jgi:hypothetical protein
MYLWSLNPEIFEQKNKGRITVLKAVKIKFKIKVT